MSALASISIKQQDGTYRECTLSILDEPNKLGYNIEIYEPQTKEQREAKDRRVYHGSGNVFWTNGTVKANIKKRDKE